MAGQTLVSTEAAQKLPRAPVASSRLSLPAQMRPGSSLTSSCMVGLEWGSRVGALASHRAEMAAAAATLAGQFWDCSPGSTPQVRMVLQVPRSRLRAGLAQHLLLGQYKAPRLQVPRSWMP